ncbi:MAG TPA: thioredoxin domain-containing protein [Spirochaetota bacterium]|nr:thioredoxin domain-containing protein [Spirochaetota bacterium]HQF09199.1 thioredoxin domain-containing protein [Spirochaetota bacterium]HQH97740.1 thioredoxin domain-containing protein [Spirochaetota bacterium]HRS77558.1 thioredoxin domain-containing protein [Spirochaetota bacterium]HRT75177.1 thioredoxin domain-containing protein [Spirochaetota bacterium]
MNHLKGQQSPYLLQHLHNPVDWHPWGEEAFALARSLDRPIFLSIGYSTCHWCHVMERESFENGAVAAALNGSFVSIKVDREERPDIDRVYMTACHLMTGTGGWPLTIIMTPAGKPFFAATYLPRKSARGRAGLLEILGRVKDVWRDRRAEVDASAESVTAALGGRPAPAASGAAGEEELRRASDLFAAMFDAVNGGFGEAPKFPSPHNLLFLLRRWKMGGDDRAGAMVIETLRRMRMGGIYDHVGFGFHRYSTDGRWLVPHFEKMLYDQAMLAMAYAEAYQACGDPLFAETARQIFEYVSRDMTSPEGCFYSAEDADSEGREGAFYLWRAGQIMDLLGAGDGRRAMEAYSISDRGNFRDEATGRMTGENILHLGAVPGDTARMESIREKLFAARERRPRPFRDDKVLADWNGLMIAALALGARALGDDRYLRMARDAASFIGSRMMTGGDRLLHRFRNGGASVPGNLDDYAFVAWGLIELYQAGFDPEHLDLAIRLSASMLKHFADGGGRLAFAPRDGEKLVAETVETHDGAYPSGHSAAYYNLVRISRLTGDPAWEASAERILAGAGEGLRRHPLGYGMLLAGLQYALGESCEVVLAGDADDGAFKEMAGDLHREYRPGCVIMARPDGEPGERIGRLAPFTAAMRAGGGRAAAYVCRGKRCFPPVHTAADMRALLEIKST